MTGGGIEEEARQNFNSGYNCAESVLVALSQQPVFQGRDCLRHIPRMATGFGGGLARNGSICGALAGGVIAIGLVLGRDDAKGSRDPCYPAVDRLLAEFQEAWGSWLCREISRVDLKTVSGQKIYQQVVHFEVCNQVVAWAARRAGELITEFVPGSTGIG